MAIFSGFLRDSPSPIMLKVEINLTMKISDWEKANDQK